MVSENNTQEQQIADEQAAYNAQVMAQQAYGSAASQMEEQEVLNMREFYLQYEDFLSETMHYWSGEVKKDDGTWVKIKDLDGNEVSMMSEVAANIVANILRSFLTQVVRLSNYEGRDVRLYSFQARKHVSRWLHTTGATKHKIPIEHLGMISFTSGQLAHASLNWAKNGGGQRFMNTSIRSFENVSHTSGAGPNRPPMNAGGDGGSAPPKKGFWGKVAPF